MRQMSAKDLKKHLETTPILPLVLDVREAWEFQTCHIQGSVHMPMGQIPNAYKNLDPAQETIVVCHHGMRSLQVAQYLERAGFSSVVNLTGGVDAWAREVDPDMPVY